MNKKIIQMYFDRVLWEIGDFFSGCWYRRLVIKSAGVKFEQEPHMFVTSATALFGEEEVEFNAFCGVWVCWETHDEYEYFEGYSGVSGKGSAWSYEGTYVSNWHSAIKSDNTKTIYDGFDGEVEDIIEETSEIDHNNKMPVETAMNIISMCYAHKAGLR